MSGSLVHQNISTFVQKSGFVRWVWRVIVSGGGGGRVNSKVFSTNPYRVVPNNCQGFGEDSKSFIVQETKSLHQDV